MKTISRNIEYFIHTIENKQNHGCTVHILISFFFFCFEIINNRTFSCGPIITSIFFNIFNQRSTRIFIETRFWLLHTLMKFKVLQGNDSMNWLGVDWLLQRCGFEWKLNEFIICRIDIESEYILHFPFNRFSSIMSWIISCNCAVHSV